MEKVLRLVESEVESFLLCNPDIEVKFNEHLKYLKRRKAGKQKFEAFKAEWNRLAVKAKTEERWIFHFRDQEWRSIKGRSKATWGYYYYDYCSDKDIVVCFNTLWTKQTPEEVARTMFIDFAMAQAKRWAELWEDLKSKGEISNAKEED